MQKIDLGKKIVEIPSIWDEMTVKQYITFMGFDTKNIHKMSLQMVELFFGIEADVSLKMDYKEFSKLSTLCFDIVKGINFKFNEAEPVEDITIAGVVFKMTEFYKLLTEEMFMLDKLTTKNMYGNLPQIISLLYKTEAGLNLTVEQAEETNIKVALHTVNFILLHVRN